MDQALALDPGDLLDDLDLIGGKVHMGPGESQCFADPGTGSQEERREVGQVSFDRPCADFRANKPGAVHNRPEMIAWALRDYCRLAGTRTAFIDPGSPWRARFVESFNSRARDEVFNVEEFGTLLEAQVIVEGRACQRAQRRRPTASVVEGLRGDRRIDRLAGMQE